MARSYVACSEELIIWIHFAQTGNPTVKGINEWLARDSNTDKYLLIDDLLKVKSGYSDLLYIIPDASVQMIF